MPLAECSGPFGHGQIAPFGVLADEPGGRVGHIRAEVARDAVEVGQEAGVTAGGFELRLVDAAQQQDGMVAGRLPQVAALASLLE
jgi:hypothetical protein